MKPTFIVASGVAVALGAAAAADAQTWSWETLAVRTVAFGSDTDKVEVRSYARYHALRLCALNAPFRLRDLRISFYNGQRQDVAARMVIPAGACTRSIDLRGDERNIERLRLRYEPILRSAVRPVVRIEAR